MEIQVDCHTATENRHVSPGMLHSPTGMYKRPCPHPAQRRKSRLGKANALSHITQRASTPARI